LWLLALLLVPSFPEEFESLSSEWLLVCFIAFSCCHISVAASQSLMCV
jgi:hypothetical protein